jgi:hypothetical protein
MLRVNSSIQRKDNEHSLYAYNTKMISNVSFQAPPFMENIHANVKDIPEGILYIYQCLGYIPSEDRLFLFSKLDGIENVEELEQNFQSIWKYIREVIQEPQHYTNSYYLEKYGGRGGGNIHSSPETEGLWCQKRAFLLYRIWRLYESKRCRDCRNENNYFNALQQFIYQLLRVIDSIHDFDNSRGRNTNTRSADLNGLFQSVATEFSIHLSHREQFDKDFDILSVIYEHADSVEKEIFSGFLFRQFIQQLKKGDSFEYSFIYVFQFFMFQILCFDYLYPFVMKHKLVRVMYMTPPLDDENFIYKKMFINQEFMEDIFKKAEITKKSIQSITGFKKDIYESLYSLYKNDFPKFIEFIQRINQTGKYDLICLYLFPVYFKNSQDLGSHNKNSIPKLKVNIFHFDELYKLAEKTGNDEFIIIQKYYELFKYYAGFFLMHKNLLAITGTPQYGSIRFDSNIEKDIYLVQLEKMVELQQFIHDIVQPETINSPIPVCIDAIKKDNTLAKVIIPYSFLSVGFNVCITILKDRNIISLLTKALLMYNEKIMGIKQTIWSSIKAEVLTLSPSIQSLFYKLAYLTGNEKQDVIISSMEPLGIQLSFSFSKNNNLEDKVINRSFDSSFYEDGEEEIQGISIRTDNQVQWNQSSNISSLEIREWFGNLVKQREKLSQQMKVWEQINQFIYPEPGTTRKIYKTLMPIINKKLENQGMSGQWNRNKVKDRKTLQQEVKKVRDKVSVKMNQMKDYDAYKDLNKIYWQHTLEQMIADASLWDAALGKGQNHPEVPSLSKVRIDKRNTGPLFGEFQSRFYADYSITLEGLTDSKTIRSFSFKPIKNTDTFLTLHDFNPSAFHSVSSLKTFLYLNSALSLSQKEIIREKLHCLYTILQQIQHNTTSTPTTSSAFCSQFMDSMKNLTLQSKIHKLHTYIYFYFLLLIPQHTLLSIKRGGDWSQIEHCIQTGSLFISFDILSIFYAHFRGCGCFSILSNSSNFYGTSSRPSYTSTITSALLLNTRS